jgi:hypothetical protein
MHAPGGSGRLAAIRRGCTTHQVYLEHVLLRLLLVVAYSCALQLTDHDAARLTWLVVALLGTALCLIAGIKI